jgi:ribose transport system permease protein
MNDRKINSFMAKYAVPFLLLAFILLIQAFNMNKALLGWANLKVILTQSTILGLISLGLSIIVISGPTDMSIGGTIGLMGAVFSVSFASGKGILLSVIITALVAIAIFIVFSLLIAKLQYPAIIISIALMFLCQGLERLYTGGIFIWPKDIVLREFASGSTLGIPNLVYFLIITYALCYIFLNHTKQGFDIRVTGENEKAAIEIGINTTKIKYLSFGIAFAVYLMASILDPIRLGGSQLYAGQTYLLPAMAATFLGSSMITPGRVNLIGTLIGSVFMSIILNFLTFLGVPFYFVPVVQGLLLMVGVALGTMRDRSIKQIQL